MTGWQTPYWHRDRARAARRNAPVAHRMLWQRLRGDALGVSFRRKAPLGPYIADFLCPSAGLVITVTDRATPEHGDPAEWRHFLQHHALRQIVVGETAVLSRIDAVLLDIAMALRRSGRR